MALLTITQVRSSNFSGPLGSQIRNVEIPGRNEMLGNIETEATDPQIWERILPSRSAIFGRSFS